MQSSGPKIPGLFCGEIWRKKFGEKQQNYVFRYYRKPCAALKKRKRMQDIADRRYVVHSFRLNYCRKNSETSVCPTFSGSGEGQIFHYSFNASDQSSMTKAL